MKLTLGLMTLLLWAELLYSKHIQKTSDFPRRNAILKSNRREYGAVSQSEYNVDSDRKHDSRRRHNTKGSCCKNGGLCILGSFCHCKKEFYGRHCEHYAKSRNCGKVKHGQWMKSGCDLCHCMYGKTACLVRVFSGCDDKPIPKEFVRPADPRNPVTVLSKEEQEDYYDYEDYTNDTKDTSDVPIFHSLSEIAFTIVSTFVVFLIFAT